MRDCYNAVTATDPCTHESYRLFHSSGLNHCYDGSGAYSAGTSGSLVGWSWVELGKALGPLNTSSVVFNKLFCPLYLYSLKGALQWSGDAGYL